MGILAFKHIPEIAKRGILQVLNKLCSPTFIHPLLIHIIFNKSDLIHESGAILKRFPLTSTTFAWKHSIRISKVHKAHESHGISKGFAVTLQVVAFDPCFRNDKDSPEITKIPERVRVQTIGGISNPGATATHSMYPNGLKGHRRNREAFVVPTSSTDTRLASDVLYDHVDPGTLVIAIEAIYLDPRAK